MEEKTENTPTPQYSLLFTLKAWLVNENTSTSKRQWRMRLQNIRSGEVFYCNDDRALFSLLDELLIKQENLDEQ